MAKHSTFWLFLHSAENDYCPGQFCTTTVHLQRVQQVWFGLMWFEKLPCPLLIRIANEMGAMQYYSNNHDSSRTYTTELCGVSRSVFLLAQHFLLLPSTHQLAASLDRQIPTPQLGMCMILYSTCQSSQPANGVEWNIYKKHNHKNSWVTQKRTPPSNQRHSNRVFKAHEYWQTKIIMYVVILIIGVGQVVLVQVHTYVLMLDDFLF